jgi:hypothetical protein
LPSLFGSRGFVLRISEQHKILKMVAGNRNDTGSVHECKKGKTS